MGRQTEGQIDMTVEEQTEMTVQGQTEMTVKGQTEMTVEGHTCSGRPCNRKRFSLNLFILA